MSAEDDAIAVTIIEPKSWIDGGVCAVGMRISVIKQRRRRVRIHTKLDDPRGRLYQTTLIVFVELWGQTLKETLGFLGHVRSSDCMRRAISEL